MSPTQAVSISPAINDLTLPPCATCQERVDVFLAQHGAATVDVYFLSDTTASMGTILSAVQSDLSSILTEVGTAGSDVQYGVGNYKDFYSDASGNGPPAPMHFRPSKP